MIEGPLAEEERKPDLVYVTLLFFWGGGVLRQQMKLDIYSKKN